MALVEHEQQLRDDPQKEKGYKDCDGDDDPQMHGSSHGYDPMGWGGDGSNGRRIHARRNSRDSGISIDREIHCAIMRENALKTGSASA